MRGKAKESTGRQRVRKAHYCVACRAMQRTWRDQHERRQERQIEKEVREITTDLGLLRYDRFAEEEHHLREYPVATFSDFERVVEELGLKDMTVDSYYRVFCTNQTVASWLKRRGINAVIASDMLNLTAARLEDDGVKTNLVCIAPKDFVDPFWDYEDDSDLYWGLLSLSWAEDQPRELEENFK